MKVSVVIPTFNRCRLVSQAIESVLAQTFTDYEIIVIDDGSSDETGRLAEIAGARLVRHRQNRGYGAALKSGIRAVRALILIRT